MVGGKLRGVVYVDVGGMFDRCARLEVGMWYVDVDVSVSVSKRISEAAGYLYPTNSPPV